MPAAIYIETHGGTGVGGTDDHAGVDIGRTYTETPHAASWRAFLDHIRAGDADAHGDQGSAAKWAHAAMALAVRVHGCPGGVAAPDPRAVLKMLTRVMSEGDARAGAIGADLGPQDACDLLRAWLRRDRPRGRRRRAPGDPPGRVFSHAALYRRARRAHERGLARAVENALAAAIGGGDPRRRRARPLRRVHPGRAVRAGDRLPRPREAQARRTATASRRGSPSSPTPSAGCTA